MALWNRVVTIEIGPPGGAGRSFSGFHTTFDVKMSKSSTPNKAVIEVTNLGPVSLALAQAPGALFRLLVGYEGDVPRAIFQGTAVKNGVRIERHGVDAKLRIEAQDGGAEYATARASVSYATQTSAQQIFNDLASALGVPLGTVRVPTGLVFPSGRVLSGSVRDLLDGLATSTGCEWYIRDGALQFIELGGDTGEAAVVFSAEAGNLVGSPTPCKGGIEVRALIAPTIRPGKPFVVRSRDTNGEYTATDVQFRGDSGAAAEFYCVVSGTPRA